MSDYKNLANTKDSSKEKVSLEQTCFSYILEEAIQRFTNLDQYKEEVIAAQKNVEHIRAQIKLANDCKLLYKGNITNT